jgi:hypothetical protein
MPKIVKLCEHGKKFALFAFNILIGIITASNVAVKGHASIRDSAEVVRNAQEALFVRTVWRS